MKWTAHVTALAARPRDAQEFNIIGFAADSEGDAARIASNISAKRLYGDEGITTFIETKHAPLYITSIGLYDGKGVTRGRSLRILLLEYGK